MAIVGIILWVILIPLGIFCFFRPVLLLYIFATLPVLRFIPTTSPMSLKFGSINIMAPDYLILIMVCLLLYYFLFKRQPEVRLFTSPITKVIVAVFIWDIFIGILSYLKGFHLENVLRHLASESIMFIAILMPQIEDIDIKKERFFTFGIIIGIVFTFFAIWRYFVSHEFETTSSGTLRTLLGNDVVILLFAICYILFYSDYFRKHKMLSVCGVSLLCIGISFTGHRSGWIAFFFVLVMWYFYNKNKMKTWWIPVWGFALLLTFLLTLPTFSLVPGQSMVGDMGIRFRDTFDLENRTTQERLSKWKYSFEINKEHPLLGLGRFSVQTLAIDGSNPHLLKRFPELNRSVHNIFVDKLLHEGLLGLAVIIIFFYVILKQFKKSLFINHRYKQFLKVYILAFILFSMFNTSFTSPLERVFIFFALGFLNVEIIKGSIFH